MEHQYPQFFARFYDLIYHHMRDSVDFDYFQDQILKAKGKVLEIGAGTGRLFTAALSRGADIYGIDISQPMISELLKKLNSDQHHRISRQNITNFEFDFRFDLIIAPFRVMMHLDEKNDQIRALNNVYRHLNTNGQFIFDAFVPDLNQLISGLDNVEDFRGEYEPGKKIKRIVTTKPDLINQTLNINFRIEWEEDGEDKHGEWETFLRFFFRYELEHLIERSAFKNYKIFGDYLGNSLDKDSKEFLTVCTRTG